MTNYKNIFGKPVKFLATDPDNAEAEGQIWYNSTSDTFKSIVALEAWSSGAPLITARNNFAGAGTQTAGLGFGGYGPPFLSSTEEYNGSGWATGGSLNVARAGLGGAGSQTAAVTFGGDSATGLTNATEEYDGSTWTPSPGNMNTSRKYMAGFGIQTAAVSAGGNTGSDSVATEEYNGSAWTSVNNMATARRNLVGVGLETTGLAFMGQTTTVLNSTEEYDGTNWTTGGNLNTARNEGGGAGDNTSALAFGGYTPTVSSATENYDGTSWSTSPATLSTARGGLAYSNQSPSSSALAFGGFDGTVRTTVTEEYNKSATVITAAAWSSGGNLNTGRGENFGYAGTQTVGIAFGGFDPGASPFATAKTESYNGTSWSEVNDLNNARWDLSGDGPDSAAITAGGAFAPAGASGGQTEEWNGTSWTEVNDLSTARRARTSGTQTAAIVGGGKDAVTGATEEFDGTSWTAGGTMNTPRGRGGQAGPQTATIVASGTQDPPNVGNVENYNGTAWTEDTNVLVPTRACQAAGGQDDLLLISGSGTPTGFTQRWNGTSWITDVNLGYSGSGGAANGPSTAALQTGGGSAQTTVEYNEETTALNLKTLTTS